MFHSLASSERTKPPFLVVMVLPIRYNTLLNSTAVRGHGNMSTLIHIPVGHVRFVPAHKQSDGTTSDLPPVKWPVGFVLMANEK